MTNRRGFIAAIAGLAVAPFVKAQPKPVPELRRMYDQGTLYEPRTFGSVPVSPEFVEGFGIERSAARLRALRRLS